MPAMNTELLACAAFLLLAPVLCSGATTNSPVAKDKTVKVLFLGNSYTDGIQATFRQVVSTSPYTNSVFDFRWGGGVTLDKLIRNGRAFRCIEQEKWDYVVLQEQSLTPAILGRPRESFYQSVDTLVEKIRGIGAEPILYMTWGRRDGFEGNTVSLPDFEAMQAKLSEAYRHAAKKHGIALAPVGEAWAEVRKKDPTLGLKLYQKDGSHPSQKGSFVATCVFLRVLFDDSLEQVALPEGMSEQESATIRETVSGMPMPSTHSGD
jgi:hypothetical protein